MLIMLPWVLPKLVWLFMSFRVSQLFLLSPFASGFAFPVVCAPRALACAIPAFIVSASGFGSGVAARASEVGLPVCETTYRYTYIHIYIQMHTSVYI